MHTTVTHTRDIHANAREKADVHRETHKHTLSAFLSQNEFLDPSLLLNLEIEKAMTTLHSFGA